MDKKKEKKKKPQLSLSSPQATVFDIFKLIALTVWYLTSISLNNMLSLPAGGPCGSGHSRSLSWPVLPAGSTAFRRLTFSVRSL